MSRSTAWLDLTDLTKLSQDAAGTTPVTTSGDPIGLVTNKGVGGWDASQVDADKRPTYDGGGAAFDGVDDALDVDIPTGGLIGAFYYAGDKGKGAFGIDLSAGTFSLGNAGNRLWEDTVQGLLLFDWTLSEAEVDLLDRHFSSSGDFDDLVNGNNQFRGNGLTSLPVGMTLPSLTNGNYMFYDNGLTSLPEGMTLPSLTSGDYMFYDNGLTSLPEGMTLPSLTSGAHMFRDNGLTSLPVGMTLPSLTNGNYMFRGNGLTSLPVGMTLPSLTSGDGMFRNNVTMTTVPSDFAQGSDCTDWINSFTSTALTSTSIDNILTNLAARGTINGTFDQSGGSAPSATGEAAIDTLRAAGWTISVTGGY